MLVVIRFIVYFEQTITTHMHVYTVDVQTTVFFIFTRLIVDMLQGRHEWQIKCGKELCTNMRLLYR